MCGHAGNPEKSKTGGGVIVDDAGLGVDINVLKLIATPKGTKLAISMLMLLLKAIEKLLNVNTVASCIFVCVNFPDPWELQRLL